MNRNTPHGIIKGSIAMFIAVLLAFSPISPISNVNATPELRTQISISENFVNSDPKSPYGYAMLAEEANGIAMQKLYNSMDLAVAKYANGGGNIPRTDPFNSDTGGVFYEIPSASFTGKDFGLSLNEMISVYFTYRADHPEAFFLPPSYLFTESTETIYLVISKDYVLESERIKYTELAQEKLAEFKNTLKKDDGDFEITIKAHDLIMNENFYRYDSPNTPSTLQSAHSIVGWLDQSGIVCEGYAKAFQFLLNGCGVECLYVTGVSKGQAHAWNAVKCDSTWFWVDATFNDQSNLPGGYYHYYFGLPNVSFLEDHTPGSRTFGSTYQFKLPDFCDSFDYFYYKKVSAFISSSESSDLMKTLTDNAKKGFDSNNYTVTLFAQNNAVKNQAITNLNNSNLVASALESQGLTNRCDTNYSVLTISSADAGDGGCIIYVNFNYHPCDVDRNSFVEKSDSQLVIEYLCGNIEMPKYADADQNGKVTIFDAVFILQKTK